MFVTKLALSLSGRLQNALSDLYIRVYVPCMISRREGRHHQFSYDDVWTVRVHLFRIVRPIGPQRERRLKELRPMQSQSQLYGP